MDSLVRFLRYGRCIRGNSAIVGSWELHGCRTSSPYLKPVDVQRARMALYADDLHGGATGQLAKDFRGKEARVPTP
jgi:hypothetical protein